MALLRADAGPLLPRLRAELTALLASLPDGDWADPTPCPGWSVHDLAAHLLGVELGNVSVRRDHWELGPAEGDDLDAWLNRFNQQWVDAAQRISPALLIELINMAGLRFEEHVATLDLDATGAPVVWATGSDQAPVWLDVAREYMERYVHQQQIRQATGRLPLGASFTGPVLMTAAHALPRALAAVTRPAGTVVTFTAEGHGGGTWYVVRATDAWALEPNRPDRPPVCQAFTTADDAVRLYVRDPSAAALTWQGDAEIAAALAGVKAILG
jgi:uncharacterized protein (TIGR03083 family)